MPLRFLRGILLAIACTALLLPTLSVNAEDSASFQILFNGKNLEGWKGLPGLWSVEDGAITGQTTDNEPIKANTFLVWQGGDVSDFEFRCLVRFEGNNSGVQYRSELTDPDGLALKGYQADLHPRADYMGMMYGEKTGRGIIATGGQQVVISADGKKQVTPINADHNAPTERWNELRIIAVGNRLVHQINGVTTIDLTDNHPEAFATGLLGLQLHRGPAMKVQFRNLLYRKLTADQGGELLDSLAAPTAAAETNDEATVKPSKQPLETWLRSAPQPQWVWAKRAGSNQKVWFRRAFTAKANIKSARLYATCDNRLQLFLNGKLIEKSSRWEQATALDVTKAVRSGQNLIACECQNDGGIAALIAKVTITYADGSEQQVATDSTWKQTEKPVGDWKQTGTDDSDWLAAVKINALGEGTWGIPGTATGGGGQKNNLIRPYEITAPPGFEVTQVYEVPRDQGSWVSLASDDKGRLYACDQGGAGLYRLTLRKGQDALVEKVSVGSLQTISGAQGLLWDDGALWLHRNGGHLYRLTDSDGDDMLDSAQQYPGTRGGGEHGNHAVIKTPDGKAIYMVGGNMAPLAEHQRSRVPTWYEGHLITRMWDSNGHARGRLAPGGWITRLDPETKQQTVLTTGFRNEYDAALNRFGDLFAYDADMEWDLGLPWYRPTRICFAASGADYGWRSGSGKWPTYYEDTLPPVVEIGPGSPTGVISGLATSFPTKYRDALFACDWTFGTMYAIHLQPDGAGYTGTVEPFVFGAPLPLTDATVGTDGCLYFAVGGRGTASGVYRVRYVGDQSTDLPTDLDAAAAAAREQREKLERFHGLVDNQAIAEAWPHLSSTDRYIRHAARIAVESQPVDSWAAKVADETDPQSKITATVALARRGNESHKDAAIAGLLKLPASELTHGQLLGLLRGYALIFTQLGAPSNPQRQQVIDQLDGLLPSKHADQNRELIRVLAYLRSPTVAAKAMQLINDRGAPSVPPWSDLASRNASYGGRILDLMKSPPPSDEIMYAYLIRELRDGWTQALQRDYFTFLNEAAKTSGGASYAGYLTRIRDEALALCTSEQRVALNEITGENFDPKPDFDIAEIKGPGQRWTVGAVAKAMRGPKDFAQGRSMFFSAKCAACHRLRSYGDAIGPDLTSIPNKFDQDYVIEAIVNPSKHISDQYGSSRVLTIDGQILEGLVVKQDNGDLTLYPVGQDAKPVAIPAEDVESISESKVSQMPAELLDTLSAEEVRDLITYLMSAGNEKDRRWTSK